MRKTISLLLMINLIVAIFCACKSPEKAIVGEWYNEDGRCLDVRSDGSWKLEDSYGTGQWKVLDDGTYEFTDFYGDTRESEIYQDDSGEYIKFRGWGEYYRDE